MSSKLVILKPIDNTLYTKCRLFGGTYNRINEYPYTANLHKRDTREVKTWYERLFTENYAKH